MMTHNPLHSLNHTLRHAIHRNGLTHQKRRKVIQKFDEHTGLLYFGQVDQHNDDHHVIRGLTLSSSHKDDNYSIGTYDDYNIGIVDRLDIFDDAKVRHKTHSWLIVEIALQSDRDIPHVFIGGNNHHDSSYSHLFTAFPSLSRVPLGTFQQYSPEFSGRYSIYTTPSQFIEVEKLFNNTVTQMIAAHFWPLSIEISHGYIYIYADNHVVTEHVLHTMLTNGIWLARQLDQ